MDVSQHNVKKITMRVSKLYRSRPGTDGGAFSLMELTLTVDNGPDATVSIYYEGHGDMPLQEVG